MRAAVIFALATLGLTACGEVPDDPRPFTPPFEANVLLVSLDTTRADHLSVYGYGRPTTPRIEALAARGHRFDAAFTVIPSTLPSHAAMLTSLYPSSLGVRGNGQRVPAEADTLAERLRARGYRTGAFVSETPLDRSTGIDQGFEVFDGPGDHAVREAIRWIESLGGSGDRRERFFAFVHLFDPHARYLVHSDLPDALLVPTGAYPGERGFLAHPERFTAEHVARTITAYDGEIRHADRRIGGLLDALQRLGVSDRTVTIFVSDHGETLDELLSEIPYAFDHGEFLHGRELRVPLVVALPREFRDAAPAVHADPVSTLDLMPTVLELVGAPCEAPCEGRSLVPLLLGDELSPSPVISERRWISPEVPPPGERYLSVVDRTWRRHFTDEGVSALFDLTLDPDEEIDVSAAHPEVAERMDALLVDWTDAHAASLWAPPRTEIDPEIRRSLEALGYLDEPGRDAVR